MAGKKPYEKNRAIWMAGDGPDSDVVVSSRVRLARNLRGMPFPQQANEEQMASVFAQIRAAVEATPSIGPTEILTLQELLPMERQLVVEEHLTSPQHVQNVNRQ